jgi:DNA-binding response OmpR family regulator
MMQLFRQGVLVAVSADPYVLVVDDSPDNLFFLQFLLEEEGYQVKTAESGALALAEVRKAPPSLILLDMMMPDLSGCDVAQQMRKDPALSQTPILLVTARGDMNLAKAIESGINDLIHKPFDINEVIAKVRALLNRDEDTISPESSFYTRNW